MAFDIAGDAYQRFMGVFSDGLAASFADFAGITADSRLRVLDVGCGTGALTAELVVRLGAAGVSAADPSPPLGQAIHDRLPEVDVRLAPAEHLPFADGEFDAALAQLVVPFMRSPEDGVREMSRVTRPGGVLAVCVWDHPGGRSPLSLFWDAVAEVDPGAPGESRAFGASEGQLGDLLLSGGLSGVVEGEVVTSRRYVSFQHWWEPYTLGVGPAGDYVRSLDDAALHRVQEACRSRIPDRPFTLQATAWAARGQVPDPGHTVLS